MIVWDQSYSVGNTILDGHHIRLFGLINRVNEYLVKFESETHSLDVVYVQGLLNEIADFAAVHFEYEENILREMGYKALNEQCAEHGDYVEKICTMLVDGIQGHPHLREVQQFLKHWWVNHVLVQDMKYKCVFLK